jgi:hypothetical protein
MPTPNEALATLRPDLGGSFQDFDHEMDRQGFIAARLLPVIEADVSSGTFGRIPLAQLLKNADVKRNSRSGYPRGDWEFQDETFATKEYGFEEPVDARDEKLYGNYFDAELVSAGLARDTVLREAEKRVSASDLQHDDLDGRRQDYGRPRGARVERAGQCHADRRRRRGRAQGL